MPLHNLTYANTLKIFNQNNPNLCNTFPDFEKIIKAYGLRYFSIKTNQDIHPTLQDFLNTDGPCVCEVFTDPNECHEPKVMAKLGADGKFIPGELKDIQWANS